MNEAQLKKMIAEYDCITDIDPKLDLSLNDFYLKGFKNSILCLTVGGVWFGPCGSKNGYTEWEHLTEEKLRDYLEKQKERYEKRQKQLAKANTKPTEVKPLEAPFHAEETKFYVVAAIITEDPLKPTLKYWKTKNSSGEWTNSIADATHYQSAGVAKSKFSGDEGYLNNSGIPFLQWHYGNDFEVCALEATATVEFRKL
jgi:hypothetical protein